MILVQKGLIYHPVKKSAVHIEMHTQLGLATLVTLKTVGTKSQLIQSQARRTSKLGRLIFEDTMQAYATIKIIALF